MNKLTTKLPIIKSFTFFLILWLGYSCIQNPATCPSSNVSVKHDSFIIQLDEPNQFINALIKDLQFAYDTSGMEIKTATCPCDPALIQIQVTSKNSEIKPDEKQKIAKEVLDQNGYGLSGTVTKNFKITRDNHINQSPIFRASTDAVIPKILEDEIIIAIVDSGIDYKGMSDFLWTNKKIDGATAGCDGYGDSGYDLARLFLDANPRKVSRHGTNIAQIIKNNLNGKKIPARFIDIRIFDEHNNTDAFTAICGIRLAQFAGADVLNLSWGYYSKADTLSKMDSLFRSNLLATPDVVYVASAGNDGVNTDQCPHFISGFIDHGVENMISTTTHANETLWKHGNYGVKTVTLAAQGKSTSYSAAHVTAIAAEAIYNVFVHKTYRYFHGPSVVKCIENSVKLTKPELEVKTKGIAQPTRGKCKE